MEILIEKNPILIQQAIQKVEELIIKDEDCGEIDLPVKLSVFINREPQKLFFKIESEDLPESLRKYNIYLGEN